MTVLISVMNNIQVWIKPQIATTSAVSFANEANNEDDDEMYSTHIRNRISFYLKVCKKHTF